MTTDEEYELIKNTANGIGGYGQPIPKDVQYKGWVCPKCSNVYSPYIKQCGNCNIREFISKLS